MIHFRRPPSDERDVHQYRKIEKVEIFDSGSRKLKKNQRFSLEEIGHLKKKSKLFQLLTAACDQFFFFVFHANYLRSS